MAKCRSCGAEILFIKSSKGMHPVDAEEIHFEYKLNGPDRVVTGNGEVLPGVISPEGSERGFRSHFATCPDAKRFRKKRGHR